MEGFVFMCLKKPNLFIVGAPKSATTSLYKYLDEHPNVFCCRPKEPKFFSSKYNNFPHNGPGDKDKIDKLTIKDKKEYFKLFKNSHEEKIIAEGSTDYLYFKQTAYDIKKESPNAKIIIMLRNPIQRAFSAYKHLRRDMRETLSFRKGLNIEEERIKKNYGFIWYYKSVGMYYSQVKTYLDVFGDEQVKIILFEDFKENTRVILNEILLFLELDNNISLDTSQKYNVSGIPKNYFIQKLLVNSNLLKTVFKIFTPYYLRKKIKKRVLNNNLDKIKIDYKDQKYLKNFFEEDILKLQNLISYDLSRWLD
jgi:hypothetical protein